MASIGSLTSAYGVAYNPYQGQQVSPVQKTEKAASPVKVEAGDREQDLNQKLDTQLTEKLTRIRQQIGSTASPAAGGDGVRRSLDIRA